MLTVRERSVYGVAADPALAGAALAGATTQDYLLQRKVVRGVPTRFLTGTDEHSVNIAMRAAEQGKSPREFVDEKVALFREAGVAPLEPSVDRPGAA